MSDQFEEKEQTEEEKLQAVIMESMEKIWQHNKKDLPREKLWQYAKDDNEFVSNLALVEIWRREKERNKTKERK